MRNGASILRASVLHEILHVNVGDIVTSKHVGKNNCCHQTKKQERKNKDCIYPRTEFSYHFISSPIVEEVLVALL